MSTAAQRTNLYKSLSARGWRTSEPLSEELVCETPSLTQSIGTALIAKGYSYADIARLAGFSESVKRHPFYYYALDGLQTALADHYGEDVEEILDMSDFQENSRTLAEILEAEQEFFGRVWYERSVCHALRYEQGDREDTTEAQYKVSKDARARFAARRPDLRLCESDFEWACGTASCRTEDADDHAQLVLRDTPGGFGDGAALLPARLARVAADLPDANRTTDAQIAAAADADQRRLLVRQYGGQRETVSAIAVRSLKLMSVDASGAVRHSLGSALSELHTLAGWCCFDSGVSADVIRAHFARGAELAAGAGDTYLTVDALYHAAMAMQHEAPNDALKMLQLVQFRLAHEPSDHPRTGTLSSWLHADSARCLVALDRPGQARSSLAAARDGWDPADRFDQADMDHVMAQAHRDLGWLDSAEQLAAASARTWGKEDRRDGVQAAITLAAIHVETGDRDGLTLAENIINDVAALRSDRARARLDGLADVLAARSDGSSRELAVHARRVATRQT